jgi:hypothetical protein
MVFNLKNNRDLIWVLILLFFFNITEYFLPSRFASVSAYIIGALSFISIIEICLYFIKRNSLAIFFLLTIILLILFNLDHGFFGMPYIYGVDAGFIVAVIYKLMHRND